MLPETYQRAVGSSGLGLGWSRVAQAVARTVAPESIDRIWLFAPVRRDAREWGTALIACHSREGRRRILTASYLIVTRGRERGQGRVWLDEVGESPVEVVHEVIAGVQERSAEAEAPVEVAPQLWFGGD